MFSIDWTFGFAGETGRFFFLWQKKIFPSFLWPKYTIDVSLILFSCLTKSTLISRCPSSFLKKVAINSWLVLITYQMLWKKNYKTSCIYLTPYCPVSVSRYLAWCHLPGVSHYCAPPPSSTFSTPDTMRRRTRQSARTSSASSPYSIDKLSSPTPRLSTSSSPSSSSSCATSGSS